MKISIVGAGHVGSTTAYALLLKGLCDELVLVDVAGDLAEGEALDLRHCRAGLNFSGEIIGTDDYSATRDSDMIIITAGMARRPGMTRMDLREKNIEIMKSIVEELMKYNDDTLLFAVSNPVDVMAYTAYKESGLPAHKVFGLGTLLDTMRLRSIMAERVGMEAALSGAYVLGEHGESMFPVFSQMSADVPLDELNDLFEDVVKGGIKVIEKKGATFYAPGLSIADAVEAVAKDTQDVLPVSVFLEEHGIYIGYPAVVGRGGVKPSKMTLSPEEDEGFNRSIEVLKKAQRGI